MKSRLRLVIGDMEFQFGWKEKFVGKGKEMETEKRDLFFSAVKYCMHYVSQNFNIMYPKFKDIDGSVVALESVLKYRISPFFITSEHVKGVSSHFSVIEISFFSLKKLKK